MQIAKHEYLEEVKQNEYRTIPVISDSVREIFRSAEEDRSEKRGEPTMSEVSAKIDNITTKMADTSTLIYSLVNRLNLLEGSSLQVNQTTPQSEINILLVLHVNNENYVVLVNQKDQNKETADSSVNPFLLSIPTGNLNGGVLEGKFAESLKIAAQISIHEFHKLHKISENDKGGHTGMDAYIDRLYVYREDITEVSLKSLQEVFKVLCMKELWRAPLDNNAFRACFLFSLQNCNNNVN